MSKASMAAREKWSRIIEEQRVSGLSVARFCEERRIPASSFFPWRKKLKDLTPAPTFVEAKARGGSDVGGVVIELSRGVRIIVTRGFERELLRDVIDTIEAATPRATDGASS